jgi:hypothetical protein
MTIAAGGIVGQQAASSTTTSQCYALGTVTADGPGISSYSGGISGRIVDASGSIMNCAALNMAIESKNSSDAHRILGSVVTVLSDNFAANDMTLTGNATILPPVSSLTGQDGADTSRMDFQRDTVGTVYNPGYLDWDFDTGTDWQFISGYDFPVLYWQNSPPADPGLVLPS